MKKVIKKKPVFLIAYVASFSILLIAIIIGLRFLWCALKDYENTMPDYIINNILNEYNNKNYDSIVNQENITFSEYNNKDAYKEYLDNQIGLSKVSKREVGSKNSDERKYLIMVDSNKLATVTLKQKSEKSRYGFSQYEIQSIQPEIKATQKLVVNAPNNAKVLLNGKELTDKYITSKDIVYKDFADIPKSVTTPHKVKYTVNETLFSADVTATGFSGNKLNISTDKKTGEINIAPTCPSELEATYSSYAIEAAQAYAKFIAADSTYSELSKYLLPQTKFARGMATFSNKFYADHDKYNFLNTKATDFMQYNDKAFSCTVSFVHQVHRKDVNKDYEFNTNITLYFVNVNNKWLVSNMIINS